MSERCRVIIHADGSWETNHPAPGYSLDEAWANLVEHNPDYADLKHFDLDVTDLPPETAACKACGERHSTVDRWVVEGKRLVVDASLPNLSASLRHLIQRYEAEVDGAGDYVTLKRLERAIEQGRAGFALPISGRAAVVAELEAVLKKAGPADGSR